MTAARTAVITGAASGLGLAFARRAAGEGMRLVLADIDADALASAAKTLPVAPADLVQLRVDVSIAADIDRLADTAFERFDEVHLLFNNAGVGLNRRAWEFSEADWKWVMGVNLDSIAHAMRAFVPRLIAQQSPSWMVNTASAAGLVSTQGMAAYNASKHGVVTISETLREDLAAVCKHVGVSVLCPAWVPTRIKEAERARPERFGASSPASAEMQALSEATAKAVAAGRLSPDDIARVVFEAIEARRFYIIPHGKLAGVIRQRFEGILAACEVGQTRS
jgi:NAD(P)-dependent dehydrogenase (short-subunit alcohol dehydrogenase family)